MSKTFLIIVPFIIAVFIRFKPFDLLLRTFNTLTHELSHAFIAVLLRQKVQKIALNKDFSGVCVTKITNKKASFFISLAGYLLPVIIGYIFIRMTDTPTTTLPFYIMLTVSIIAIILAIANSFGRVWTICFAGLNFIFILVPIFRPYYNHILYFYGCTLLIENILSTITLLYITLVSPKKSGDSALLKKATRIPAICWSFFFFCFSVAALILSFKFIAEHLV